MHARFRKLPPGNGEAENPSCSRTLHLWHEWSISCVLHGGEWLCCTSEEIVVLPCFILTVLVGCRCTGNENRKYPLCAPRLVVSCLFASEIVRCLISLIIVFCRSLKCTLSQCHTQCLGDKSRGFSSLNKFVRGWLQGFYSTRVFLFVEMRLLIDSLRICGILGSCKPKDEVSSCRGVANGCVVLRACGYCGPRFHTLSMLVQNVTW